MSCHLFNSFVVCKCLSQKKTHKSEECEERLEVGVKNKYRMDESLFLQMIFTFLCLFLFEPSLSLSLSC